MPPVLILIRKFGPLLIQAALSLRDFLRKRDNMRQKHFADLEDTVIIPIPDIPHMPVTHFKPSEFACRCGRGPGECDAAPMDLRVLVMLEHLRELCGRPLVITSGQRCRFWNAEVGGVDSSQHLLGFAVDILTANRKESKALAALAETAGFTGIGVYAYFIHVDIGPTRRW